MLANCDHSEYPVVGRLYRLQTDDLLRFIHNLLSQESDDCLTRLN